MTKDTAAYYGNLARVAIEFYVRTGNRAELDAAVLYARAAARTAILLIAAGVADIPTNGGVAKS